MNIKIAWRNIWRNKKRTFITVSSVVLAVVLAVFTRSFQEGSYSKMIENAVGRFTGYVQIHQKDYWNDKTLDNGIEINNDLLKSITSVSKIKGVNLRLESFSLASNKTSTKGTLVMGVEPVKEADMLGLQQKIIKGENITKDDKSILLGSKLASYLKITVGDTLVLMGQGHWGQSAVGAFPVKGIVKMPAPNIDKQIVFMSLRLAQEYFSYDKGVTSIVVRFNDSKLTNNIIKELNNKIDTIQYKAIAWQKMSPELVQQIQSDKASGIMMIGILYMIIAFGIFGTILMMTEERKKEFAVMIAIGMQKTKLSIISIYEAVFMNLIGVIIGIIISLPLVIYYNLHPIRMSGEIALSIEKLGIEPVMPTLVSFNIFLNQTIVIIIITGIASVYPLISILKMSVIKSLRK